MEAAKSWQLTDLHVVGGLTRRLNLDYYQELFRTAKRILPAAVVQGLTAVEIQWLSDIEGMPAGQVSTDK